MNLPGMMVSPMTEVEIFFIKENYFFKTMIFNKRHCSTISMLGPNKHTIVQKSTLKAISLGFSRYYHYNMFKFEKTLF